MIPALLLSLALPVHAEPFFDAVGAYEAENYAAALPLLQKAADEGNDYAQAYLSEMYFTGNGVAKSEAKAAELANKSAKAGNVLGHLMLGQLAFVADGKTNVYDANREYKIAADAGLLAGQLNLAATDFWDKIGEYKQAVKLLKPLADSRFARIAKQDLAHAYYNGKGVSQSVKEARKWLDRTGDDDAVRRFDESEQKGWHIGVAEWAANARVMPFASELYPILKKDAKGLRPAALYLQGVMYEEGIEAPHDKELAAKSYQKALDYGYAAAKARLDALGVKAEEPPAPKAPAVAKLTSDVDAARFKLPVREHDFALVVGIEKYKGIPDAKYAERDAAAFKAHVAALGVPERNIITLTGAEATRGKLQAYLEEWLPKNVKEDSRLFVYYSGHGAPDAETKQAYLLPWDADPMFLESTAYSLPRLYGALNKLPAKTIVVALDSCFSGAGGRSVLAPGLRPLVTTLSTGDAGRLTVLAAAAGDEVTGSLDDQGHGMFTYFLLKGMDEAAKDGSAVMTARGLYASLKTRVEEGSARQNRHQTPQLTGEDAVLALLK